MISLKKSKNILSNSQKQLEILSEKSTCLSFESRLAATNLFPLTVREIDTLQINLGKMCNQVCEHCHVDAGPDRTEIMSKDTMQLCLDVLKKNPLLKTVDLTGGAPEMNPNFRWFVEELTALNIQILVRCNLTIIVANKKYHDLPEFFKKHSIEVVSSLPCYTEANTDKQRGEGVFAKSLKAIKMLNEVGYGKNGSNLILNFVYNPGGPSLPPNQEALKLDYKKRLKEDFDLEFNDLFTITNVAISRFLDFLLKAGRYEEYMDKLIAAFNPMAAENVMCRNLISVSWDGYLFDCDFNQMLELSIDSSDSNHISNFDYEKLMKRNIKINQHCFACTAGAGSSCGGSLA
jgi:radical SAM/Cys-rich protein